LREHRFNGLLHFISALRAVLTQSPTSDERLARSFFAT
jgi:hypothetical protein